MSRVEPVAEEREFPSNGSHEAREITRERRRKRERRHANGDMGTYLSRIYTRQGATAAKLKPIAHGTIREFHNTRTLKLAAGCRK